MLNPEIKVLNKLNLVLVKKISSIGYMVKFLFLQYSDKGPV